MSDEIDLAQGWASEDARQQFLVESGELASDLRTVLGGEWKVDISPEPALTMVRLMGEYGSEWPLWTHEGGTGPEHWTMLSEQLHRRLLDWAVEAEPDHLPGLDPNVTERLARDVQDELGARFVVKVIP